MAAVTDESLMRGESALVSVPHDGHTKCQLQTPGTQVVAQTSQFTVLFASSGLRPTRNDHAGDDDDAADDGPGRQRLAQEKMAEQRHQHIAQGSNRIGYAQ